ncbi:unnamed protein product [Rhizoctonia solani]|uniref:Inhibitor I9 domain-containing protein n=1 Tax=Rhizoctonia solani TaxID=456999 RepID=A0A8H2W9J4_9AGAM|nr:unnamed protein product [Rhizoctonia solani]
MTTPNTYIVVFKDNAPKADVDKAIADVEAAGGVVKHRYSSALNGFAASIPDSHIQELKALCGAADSNIRYIGALCPKKPGHV